MFGKFGGIVIISLSVAIVAGLILRPMPELPPAMSLGVSDQATPVSTLEPTIDNQDKKPAIIEPVSSTIDAKEGTSPEAKMSDTPTEKTDNKQSDMPEAVTKESTEASPAE